MLSIGRNHHKTQKNRTCSVCRVTAHCLPFCGELSWQWLSDKMSYFTTHASHPFQHARPAKCPKYPALLSASKKQAMLLVGRTLSKVHGRRNGQWEKKKTNSLSWEQGAMQMGHQWVSFPAAKKPHCEVFQLWPQFNLLSSPVPLTVTQKYAPMQKNKKYKLKKLT